MRIRGRERVERALAARVGEGREGRRPHLDVIISGLPPEKPASVGLRRHIFGVFRSVAKAKLDLGRVDRAAEDRRRLILSSMNRSLSAGSRGGSVNGADVTLCMMFPNVARAFLPHFVSKLNAVKPKPWRRRWPFYRPASARLSDSKRSATADANRFSPPTDEMRNLYSGALL